MLLDEAITLLARLKAAFPDVSLDEEQSEILVREVALLHDPSILYEAVSHLIQREERFPSIARIRLAYRSVNDARAAQRAALQAAAPAGERDIPIWVQVWNWRREQTLTARQAANTTAPGPFEQRPPVKMRPFPQFAHLEPNEPAYTFSEYEQLEREWVAAGRPTIRQASELMARVAESCAGVTERKEHE